ncbi:MAG: YkgJ family cysteine cluster protein [Meiothermus sp.]|nr:YkgJ family cysteine cluster protein [Meiothermus sp.]
MSALESTVRAAHAALDRRAEAYLEQHRLGLSCRKGCFSCCLALVVVGLAEAEYLRERLEPEVLKRVEQAGQKRLKRIAREKHRPDFATRYFLEANRCPVLAEDGSCSAHAARPLACRGVLTDLEARYCAPGAVPGLKGKDKSAYQGRLTAQHGPEHYLKAPWQSSERQAQRLWELERRQRGFTVIGELAGLIYLLGLGEFRAALEGGLPPTQQYLEGWKVLGGDWGFWAG